MPTGYPGPIKRADVWWADKVKSPDNKWENKDRRVLVIWPPEIARDAKANFVYVLGISTKPTEEQLRRGIAIALPNKQDHRTTRSGLDRPCWALATWFIQTSPCFLDKKAGEVLIDYIDLARELVKGRRPTEQTCAPDCPERKGCHYCP